MFAFVFLERGVEEGAFEACVEDGERGFEFVGGVEGEAADALERLVEPCGEAVEDPCEPVDFVAATGDGQREVEVVGGDFFRGGDEVLDRAERAADEEPAGDIEDGEREDGAEDDFAEAGDWGDLWFGNTVIVFHVEVMPCEEYRDEDRDIEESEVDEGEPALERGGTAWGRGR